MPDFNFNEPMVALYNPMPAITMKEIYKLAKHPYQHDAKKCAELAFMCVYRWGAGQGESVARIPPQKTLRLPSNIAYALHRQIGEEGIALVGDPEALDFERQLDIQGLKGLGAAHKFYCERGHDSLFKFMSRRGIKDVDELGPRRRQVYGMLINAAKADVIERELNRAQKRVNELEAGSRPAA